MLRCIRQITKAATIRYRRGGGLIEFLPDPLFISERRWETLFFGSGYRSSIMTNGKDNFQANLTTIMCFVMQLSLSLNS